MRIERRQAEPLWLLHFSAALADRLTGSGRKLGSSGPSCSPFTRRGSAVNVAWIAGLRPPVLTLPLGGQGFEVVGA